MMISILSSNHLHVDEDGYFNLWFSCKGQHVSDDFTPSSPPHLSTSFYETICPSMVSIATSTFHKLASSDNVVAPSLLRLILHDAFVQAIYSLKPTMHTSYKTLITNFNSICNQTLYCIKFVQPYRTSFFEWYCISNLIIFPYSKKKRNAK